MMVKYELKRIFTKRMNRLLLAVAVIISAVMSVFAVTSNRYVDTEGVAHETPGAARRLAEDKNRWKGEVTGDVIAQIVADRQEINRQYPEDVPNTVFGQKTQSSEDIEFMINNILSGEGDYDPSAILNLTPEQAKDMYSIWKEKTEEIVQEYGETEEQQEFLRTQYEKVDTPFYYEAPVSWDTMLTYATTYGIILVVLIGFLAAGIFADEFSLKADAVFFSCRYSRTKAVRSKILTGLLMTTVIYWTGMALLSVISYTVMGVSGFSSPYQLDQPYSIYNITFGEEYLILLLSGYIASLLSASVAMLVSAKTHSANIAVCIPFILFCVSPFIGRALPFGTFFQLTPDQLMNILNCAREPYIYQIGSMVFRQIPFVMLFYTLVAAVFLPVIFQCYRRYGLKKR
ncbi:MAG TPA: ABC transporter permease [Candidatus Mediterraneibacter norfolkensis]|nr:ABC transporter permease [Candidatus Mediterraneibacter norfolkensis]